MVVAVVAVEIVIVLLTAAAAADGKLQCNFTVVTAGQWGGWASWSECSAQCGSGVQARLRDCNNPRPQHGGAECDWADAIDTVPCQGTECVNGQNS